MPHLAETDSQPAPPRIPVRPANPPNTAPRHPVAMRLPQSQHPNTTIGSALSVTGLPAKAPHCHRPPGATATAQWWFPHPRAASPVAAGGLHSRKTPAAPDPTHHRARPTAVSRLKPLTGAAGRAHKGQRLLANDGQREALLRRWRGVAPMWSGSSRKPFSVQTAWNGEFQERWTVASGKNRVSGESGKAMKP